MISREFGDGSQRVRYALGLSLALGVCAPQLAGCGAEAEREEMGVVQQALGGSGGFPACTFSESNPPVVAQHKLVLRQESAMPAGGVWSGPPPYTGSTDATISAAQPNTRLGSASTCNVSTNGEQSCLLRWSLPISEGSQVVAAQIRLMPKATTGTSTFNVHRARARWSEFGASWNNYTSVSTWAISGAKGATDRDATPLATFSTGAASDPITLNAAGITAIQEWVNGAENAGFVVARPSTVNNVGIDFASSEDSSCPAKPTLIVWYNDP
jgi:hypothetical protein